MSEARRDEALGVDAVVIGQLVGGGDGLVEVGGRRRGEGLSLRVSLRAEISMAARSPAGRRGVRISPVRGWMV